MLIRLYADYAPWPLWGPGGLLDEEALALSDELKQRIRAWLNAYSTPRPGWLVWTPPEDAAGTNTYEDLWEAEGTRIRDAIAEELGAGYEVVFET